MSDYIKRRVLEEKHQDIKEFILEESKKEDVVAEPTTFSQIQDDIEMQNIDNVLSQLSSEKRDLEDFQIQLQEMDTITLEDLDFGTESFGGE